MYSQFMCRTPLAWLTVSSTGSKFRFDSSEPTQPLIVPSPGENWAARWQNFRFGGSRPLDNSVHLQRHPVESKRLREPAQMVWNNLNRSRLGEGRLTGRSVRYGRWRAGTNLVVCLGRPHQHKSWDVEISGCASDVYSGWRHHSLADLSIAEYSKRKTSHSDCSDPRIWARITDVHSHKGCPSPRWRATLADSLTTEQELPYFLPFVVFRKRDIPRRYHSHQCQGRFDVHSKCIAPYNHPPRRAAAELSPPPRRPSIAQPGLPSRGSKFEDGSEIVKAWRWTRGSAFIATPSSAKKPESPDQAIKVRQVAEGSYVGRCRCGRKLGGIAYACDNTGDAECPCSMATGVTVRPPGGHRERLHQGIRP